MKNILVIFLLACSFSALSQTEEPAIKATINRFFEGVESNDTTKIRISIDQEGCFLKSIIQKKDGTTVLQTENISDFFKQVIEVKDLKIKEILLSFDIKTDGPMALAWTPYRMTIDGKLSHCGVNMFTLIKRNDSWKIMGITDTRRKQGCE
jgi:hypothetical protein